MAAADLVRMLAPVDSACANSDCGELIKKSDSAYALVRLKADGTIKLKLYCSDACLDDKYVKRLLPTIVK